MKTIRTHIGVITLTLLAVADMAQAVEPVGTEFTYQGQLKSGGVPADGDYDFVFRLYDAETGGAQVGSAVTVDDWPVVDGLFTLQLDFGAGAFESDARWIEIGVRDGAGGSNYTTLLPRQPITAAPVAQYALGGPGIGGYWTLSGDDIYNNNAGKVGIGTTTPSALLEVLHSEREHGILSTCQGIPIKAVRTSTIGTWPAIHAECNSGSSNASAIRAYIMSTSPGSSSVAVKGVNHGTGGAGIGVIGTQDGSGWGVYGFTPSGRGVYGNSTDGVGVYGATPSGTGVYGVGGIGVYGLHPGSGTWPGVWGESNSTSSSATAVRGIITSTSPGSSSTGVLGVNNGTGGSGIGVWGRQDGSGYGVYGSTPSGRGVYGRSDEGVGVYGSSTNGYAGYFTGGHNYFGGNVGIGTTEPTAKVHVSTSSEQVAQFTQWGTDPGVSISLINGGSNYSALRVYSSSNNAPALSVTGTASVDVLEIYGADLAEKFPVSEAADAIAPGMVMEIDPENPGKLRVAHGAYNRRVAGVVSGAGGIPAGAILGNMPGSEDAPAIALSGRAWVHCDATTIAIELGDLLTTSDTPGHAMAVTEHTRAIGAILGKAMTALDKGEVGMVLVLINLQ